MEKNLTEWINKLKCSKKCKWPTFETFTNNSEIQGLIGLGDIGLVEFCPPPDTFKKQFPGLQIVKNLSTQNYFLGGFSTLKMETHKCFHSRAQERYNFQVDINLFELGLLNCHNIANLSCIKHSHNQNCQNCWEISSLNKYDTQIEEVKQNIIIKPQAKDNKKFYFQVTLMFRKNPSKIFLAENSNFEGAKSQAIKVFTNFVKKDKKILPFCRKKRILT